MITNCVDPSMRLQTPIREGCWLQSSLVDPNDEDQEDAWSQNSMVHIQQLLHKNDELGQNFVSDHNLLEQTLFNACATCEHFFFFGETRLGVGLGFY